MRLLFSRRQYSTLQNFLKNRIEKSMFSMFFLPVHPDPCIIFQGLKHIFLPSPFTFLGPCNVTFLNCTDFWKKIKTNLLFFFSGTKCSGLFQKMKRSWNSWQNSSLTMDRRWGSFVIFLHLDEEIKTNNVFLWLEIFYLKLSKNDLSSQIHYTVLAF